MTDKKFSAFLNRLDDQGKDVFHIASLFGESFTLDNLLELIDIKPSKLLDLIDNMLNHGLIINNSDSIKGPFSFIKKDVISLIPALIKEENLKANIFKLGAYIERKLPDNEELALNLAKLYMQIEPKERSLLYLKKTADLMVSMHKPDEALNLYEGLIEPLLEGTGEESESPILIESLQSFIFLAVHIRPTDKLQTLIEKVRFLPLYSNNKTAGAVLDIGLGALLNRQGKASEGYIYGFEGWKKAKEINDADLHQWASQLSGLSALYSGKISEAIQIFESSLGNLSELSLNLQSSWSSLMLAWCYGISGRISLGLKLAETVIENSKLKHFLYTEALAHGIIALILFEVRREDEAEPHINAALQIAEQLISPYLFYLFKPCKGYLALVKNDWEGSNKWFDESLARFKESGALPYPCSWYIKNIFALQKFNAQPGPDGLGQIPVDRLIHSANTLTQGIALRYHALSNLRMKVKYNESETLLKKSHALLHKAGAVIEKGRTQIQLSKLYIETKNPAKAKYYAKMAYATLSEIDRSLFPSQLIKILPKQSKEICKDRGLSEIVAAMDSFPDLNKYLGRIATIMSEMFGAERAAVFLKNKQRNQNPLNLQATYNFEPEDLGPFKRSDVQGLLLNAAAKKDILTIFDQEENTVLFQLNQLEFAIRSLVIIPLIWDKEVDGIIYLDNKILSGRLSENDLILMKSLTNQLLIALRSFELCGERGDLSYLDAGHSASKSDTKTLSPVVAGKSNKIDSVLKDIKKIAPTDTTVLIYGETGVGKELIAKAIHQASKRSDRPLVIVNLSALTPNLVESELFGHEKGAFTGAVASKPGRFEIANGGTIFLDEIGDLSMEVQVKLLRVLQERSFERVGSNKSIYSDFRVIAATNKDLHQMVEKGQFRSDLFYRINTFYIEIPPLRKRKEDIPALALHFLNKYSQKYNKNIKRIDKQDMEKLLAYSWPGNVRELEHIVEKAVILADNGSLLIGTPGGTHFFNPAGDNKPESLLSLEEIERDHILKIMNHTKWRIRGATGAARILAIKPSTLEFRMKKLGIFRGH